MPVSTHQETSFITGMTPTPYIHALLRALEVRSYIYVIILFYILYLLTHLLNQHFQFHRRLCRFNIRRLRA